MTRCPLLCPAVTPEAVRKENISLYGMNTETGPCSFFAGQGGGRGGHLPNVGVNLTGRKQTLVWRKIPGISQTGARRAQRSLGDTGCLLRSLISPAGGDDPEGLHQNGPQGPPWLSSSSWGKRTYRRKPPRQQNRWAGPGSRRSLPGEECVSGEAGQYFSPPAFFHK